MQERPPFPPDTRLTIFQVYTFFGAGLCAWIAYDFAADIAPWLRIAAAVLAAGVGFLLSHLAVLVLVMKVIIPRLEPGSYWSYEVDQFMLLAIGWPWHDAGKRDG